MQTPLLSHGLGTPSILTCSGPSSGSKTIAGGFSISTPHSSSACQRGNHRTRLIEKEHEWQKASGELQGLIERALNCEHTYNWLKWVVKQKMEGCQNKANINFGSSNWLWQQTLDIQIRSVCLSKWKETWIWAPQNNTELFGNYKNNFLLPTSMAPRCLEKDLNRN